MQTKESEEHDYEFKEWNEVINKHQIFVSARSVAFMLGTIIFILLVLNIIAQWLSYPVAAKGVFPKRMDQYFNFNNENNIPTFFSSLLLLFASLLLFIIFKVFRTKKVYNVRWLILAYVFLFLCLDEAVEIHERLEVVTRKIIPTDAAGFLQWTWIVPYFLLFAFLVAYCFRFVLELPRTIRNIFILSGSVYVFAAVGIESIEGFLKKLFNNHPIITNITTTSQELFEMIGIVWFIYGLLKYMALEFSRTEIIVSEK